MGLWSILALITTPQFANGRLRLSTIQLDIVLLADIIEDKGMDM